MTDTVSGTGTGSSTGSCEERVREPADDHQAYPAQIRLLAGQAVEGHPDGAGAGGITFRSLGGSMKSTVFDLTNPSNGPDRGKSRNAEFPIPTPTAYAAYRTCDPHVTVDVDNRLG